MRLTPGTWVKLRNDEGYAGPWETVGVVKFVDSERMEACVSFADGEEHRIPIVDLVLFK